MARKQITVRMDGQVWEEFKEFVTHKRERFKGVAGEEVEEALISYMSANNWPDAEMHREDDHQDTLDRHQKRETHTPQHEGVHKHNQPAEIQPYHASLDPKYAGIMAELNGMKEIHRKDFERILTRNLHLKTDKSRRDHLKTFEHLGILEPHPAVGHKILTVNQDFMNLP
jgi:hypothetical protein